MSHPKRPRDDRQAVGITTPLPGPPCSGPGRPALYTTPRYIRSFDPLAVRSFNVEDRDVPLVPDYVTRPLQSSVLRVVLF